MWCTNLSLQAPSKDIYTTVNLLPFNACTFSAHSLVYVRGDSIVVPQASVGETRVGVAAPEVLTSSPRYYDAKLVDVWASGVMLYVMLFGQFPFRREEYLDMPDKERETMERRLIVAGKKLPGLRILMVLLRNI